MRLLAAILVFAVSAAADPFDSFVLTGFDSARAGGDYGIHTGTLFSDARASIAANFPNATFSSISALSAGTLAGTDVLFLAALQLTTPLSAAEQTALFNFVLGGGSVILLLENSFWDAEAESLIDAFSMDADGVIPAPRPRPSRAHTWSQTVRSDS